MPAKSMPVRSTISFFQARWESVSDSTLVEEQPYGWVIVVVATLCCALGFGANVTVSMLVKPFEQEFGWSRAQISMAYTALSVGAALGGIFWGSLSDRIGAKRIAFFGALVLSTSLIILSQQSDLRVIHSIYFGIGALGFGSLFTPLLALVGLWFERRKGLAIGIVTAGGALGQGVAPVIIQWAITTTGWRDAMLYLGAGYLVIFMPLLALLKQPPVLQATPERISHSNDNLWGMPYRLTVPWLAFAGLFCCICMAVPIVHLVPLGVDLGLFPETAAGLLSTLMVSAIFGRLFFGFVADRTGGLLTYLAASLIQTSTVFWFTQTESLVALYVISVIFGFGFAGVMTSLLICAREAAPLRITGFAIALVSTTGWVGMGIGSYQGGHFFDVTGVYTISYGVAAMAGVVNLLVVAGLAWVRFSRTGAWRTPRAMDTRSERGGLSTQVLAE
jgi:MFS family permease